MTVPSQHTFSSRSVLGICGDLLLPWLSPEANILQACGSRAGQTTVLFISDRFWQRFVLLFRNLLVRPFDLSVTLFAAWNFHDVLNGFYFCCCDFPAQLLVLDNKRKLRFLHYVFVVLALASSGTEMYGCTEIIPCCYLASPFYVTGVDGLSC